MQSYIANDDMYQYISKYREIEFFTHDILQYLQMAQNRIIISQLLLFWTQLLQSRLNSAPVYTAELCAILLFFSDISKHHKHIFFWFCLYSLCISSPKNWNILLLFTFC